MIASMQELEQLAESVAKVAKLYGGIFEAEKHYREATDECTRRGCAARVVQAIQDYWGGVSISIRNSIGRIGELHELEMECNMYIKSAQPTPPSRTGFIPLEDF